MTFNEVQTRWPHYHETTEEISFDDFLFFKKLAKQFPYVYTEWGTLLSEDNQ